MAWEWSHTAEAYSAVYENLLSLPFEDLCIILCEWETRLEGHRVQHQENIQEAHQDAMYAGEEYQEPEFPGLWEDYGFDLKFYEKRIKEIPNEYRKWGDIIADKIWEYVEQLKTCDNGGFNAWVCPSGCHTVPFDTEEEKTYEAGTVYEISKTEIVRRLHLKHPSFTEALLGKA